jgi:hypothetical protein
MLQGKKKEKKERKIFSKIVDTVPKGNASTSLAPILQCLSERKSVGSCSLWKSEPVFMFEHKYTYF